MIIVEPPKKGHIRGKNLVSCREVVCISEGPLSEVPLYSEAENVSLFHYRPAPPGSGRSTICNVHTGVVVFCYLEASSTGWTVGVNCMDIDWP